MVCEQAYLEDFFESFCSVSTVYGTTPDMENTTRIFSSNGSRRVIYRPDDVVFSLGPFKVNRSYEVSQGIAFDGDLALGGDISYSVEIQPTFKIHTFLILGEGHGTYFNYRISGDLKVTSQSSLYGGLLYNHDWDGLIASCPIPMTGNMVNFYINPGLFVRADATIAGSITSTQDYTFGSTFDFSSKGENTINPSIGGRLASSSVEMSGSLDGSLAGGAYIETGFNLLSREIAKVCVRGEMGARFSGSFVFRNSDTENALKETKLYERLKASEVELGSFVNVSLQASVAHTGNGLTWELSEPIHRWNLVPKFSNTKLTLTSGYRTSVDAYTELTGDCIFPVSVGYKLLDANKNEVANYDAQSSYTNRASKMIHTFPGLDEDKLYEYKVYPKIKLFGFDVLASPYAEIEKTITVHTLQASNTEETSAIIGGSIEGYTPGPDNGEVGFFYNTTGNPSKDNGINIYVGRLSNFNDGKFLATLSGLQQNETYYYCAYYYSNGVYFYGETSSFKTKKKEEPNPIAISGEHKNEQTTSATIECTYKYVPNNADCGYYITKSYYENAARGNRISGGIEWDKVSVGRYEGTKEISLDNLMPDEEYQYYAYISVGNEDVATGTTKSFTTKTPKAQLFGEPQTSVTSATAGYGFENVPEGGTCQLILLKVGDPLQNAQYISVPSTSNGNYTFAGLEASTSYQYFARIEYKTRKWDSGTGSFTTQAMPTPIVITGGHYNETLNSATIECTYEQIPASTDCGYYLRGQKGSTLITSISKSIGNVEGTKIINLSDLKAGTTYYYQAYAQYQGREYLGSENSFQTLTPNAVTGPYSNVTSNKASIVCGYFNVPEDTETGVLLSYNGEEHEMPYNYGEGEHNIDIDNLYPGTSYSYSAYIKYDDEIYQGETKQFITLTPSAYVGEATNVEEESAQFEYGFRNVPEGGTCHIALQQEGGETYDYSVSDAEQDIFQLSGLQPSTTYTYWSYVDYYGETWSSNSLQFTTKTPPTPVATTGDFSNVTMNSATVTCTYENVPEGGVCGAEYTWNGGSTKQTVGSSNGTQSVTLSGLQPGTSYTYCAYIEANGQTYYGSDKTFTTESPSLAGTWNCTITKGNNTESWQITLTEDHKGSAIRTDGNSNTYEASWGVGMMVKHLLVSLMLYRHTIIIVIRHTI